MTTPEPARCTCPCGCHQPIKRLSWEREERDVCFQCKFTVHGIKTVDTTKEKGVDSARED